MSIEIKRRLQLVVEQCFNNKPRKLAKEINVSINTINNYLNSNKKNVVGVKTLLGLHEKVGININWLLTGKGEMYLSEQERKEDFNIDDILQHLTPKQKQEILTRTEEMRLMNTLKQRVDNLEKEVLSKS